jgi:DNA-binding NarL/FixJ family response regulator
MNEAIAAHIRILESTPRERVHTHEQRYVEVPDYVKLQRAPRPLSLEKQKKIMALLANGKTQREVSRELGMAESTVSKFVKRAKLK